MVTTNIILGLLLAIEAIKLVIQIGDSVTLEDIRHNTWYVYFRNKYVN